MSPQHFNDVEHQVLPGGVAMTRVSGHRSGPVLALLGGVHGDEDEGVLAVRRIVREVAAAPLSGTLLAVAPAHPAAWAAHSRFSPLDGGNLARSFPGRPDDGPTSAVAAAITDHVIAAADALIDLHSAGIAYRMPLMCGFCADGPAQSRSAELAVAFAAPVTWVHPHGAPGRSLSAATERGIPSIYAECSGGGSIRGHELDAYVGGVTSAMAALGMLDVDYRRAAPAPIRVYGAGDLDHGAKAKQHGLFVTSVRAGDVLDRGAEIGRFYDYDGDLVHVVDAHADGMVMFLRRQARTQTGDVLFVMARTEEAPK
jgi:predicted deacylase